MELDRRGMRLTSAIGPSSVAATPNSWLEWNGYLHGGKGQMGNLDNQHVRWGPEWTGWCKNLGSTWQEMEMGGGGEGGNFNKLPLVAMLRTATGESWEVTAVTDVCGQFEVVAVEALNRFLMSLEAWEFSPCFVVPRGHFLQEIEIFSMHRHRQEEGRVV